MTSIMNLSTEPKYTIKNVATQTGIRPVTLRAWERRQEFLHPYRKDNRYRLYSERDVAILRWLKYRIDDGIPISSAIHELVGLAERPVEVEAFPLTPLPGLAPNNAARPPSSAPSRSYVEQIFQALVRQDEERAGALLTELFTRFELVKVFTGVLEPLVQQISEARYRDEIPANTQYAAAAFLRRKILPLLRVRPPQPHTPFILIGCAPMESNELGPLMLAVLLSGEGYRVEYLGPDISIQDLAEYAVDALPGLVILSASSDFTAHEMRPMQSLLTKVRSAPKFAYLGRAFEECPELRSDIPGAYLGGSLETGLHQVRKLLKPR